MTFKARLWIVAALLVSSAPWGRAEYTLTDSHLHIVDFFQEGESVTQLLAAMDKAGVGHAMISGLPLMKKWHEDEPKRPRYYSGDNAGLYWYSATDGYVVEAYRSLPAEQRSRLHPFLSGFNPTDKNSAGQVRRLLERYPGVWQGIGEIFTRHDDLTALTRDEPPRANSEAMQRIYRVAAEHQLPILLHSNITSKRERNPLYRGELEEALADNPGVNFIWAHAGTSKTLHRYQGKMAFLLPTVSSLMAKYDNLYIDLSWTVLEPYLLDENGKPDQEWLRLVARYPDRFMIGSDVIGEYDNIGEILQEYRPFLDALPEEVAKRVAEQNFLALLPGFSRGEGAVTGHGRQKQ